MQWASENLVHLGAVLEIVCFSFRNQFLLRGFSIASSMAFAGYYFAVTDRPLWDAMVWEGGSILVNIVMITIFLTEKRRPSLTVEELELFKKLQVLSVEQFMKLNRVGRWQRLTSPTQLTTEGKMPEELHYVLAGEVQISKSGRDFTLPTAAFVGELAYLRDKPATASVTVQPGGVVVSWPHEALRRAVSKDEDLKHALSTLLNQDLAEKVARA